MLQGKGYFIWKLKTAEEGDPDRIAEAAKSAGLTHVIFKVLDGIWRYNMRPIRDADGNLIRYVDDILPPVIAALHRYGILVYGYQWVYWTATSTARSEAEAAIKRVKELGLDGFVIDAEKDAKNKPIDAQTYARRLKGFSYSGTPIGEGMTVPIALSSYRYPSYHQELPWKQLLESCDFVMPQVYWQESHNAGAQLKRSFDEYQKLTKLPYIPTGSAYTEHGWTATPEDIVDFMTTAKSMGLKGFNFWEWIQARNLNLWDGIARFPMGETPTPPPPDPEPEPPPPPDPEPEPEPEPIGAVNLDIYMGKRF